MLSAKDALKKLQDGNKRFVCDEAGSIARTCKIRRNELLEGQKPFAVILGCSDSRVPAEIVFDEGLGEIFVIRVAGNIVAPSQIGSVEYAVETFGTRLVVVMGHSQCGAVKATISELEQPTENRSLHLRAIVDRIRPSVEVLLESNVDATADELLELAIRSNIRASANHLRHGSAILENLIEQNELLIVGAKYCLESGEVEFFDGLP